MGGEPEEAPDKGSNDKQENSQSPADLFWEGDPVATLAPLIDGDQQIDLRFRPVGATYEHLELSFSTAEIDFVGVAAVSEVENSLKQTGYPLDLWLTLVGKEWPAKILESLTIPDGGVRLFLELQDLILFLPFEKRSDGNRPLNLVFHPPQELESRDLLTGPADTEPELHLDKIDQSILTQVVWDELPDPRPAELPQSAPMPPLQPVNRPLVRLRGQPNLSLDDQPFLTCVEITAQQTKSTINEELLKRSLARAAGCNPSDIEPLAMSHAVDELVILIRLPDEQRLHRFLTYFAYHQAKLGNQMKVAPFIALHAPRRWVWRQLVGSGSFYRRDGRLSYTP